MISLQHLRSTIEAAPAKGPAYSVDRAFLETVERELTAGRAALAQLAAQTAIGAVCATIAGTPA